MPVDIEALRAAAEKATPGKREVEPEDCLNGVPFLPIVAEPNEAICEVICDWIDGHAVISKRNVADAAFIAACDPATILSLLAERDRLLRVVDAARADEREQARWANMPTEENSERCQRAHDALCAALAALAAKEPADVR